ncbi:hypothetical protein [Polyangium aurulentum]|uniref:hypothetical protein n=1 Tax=Polyangium aurulentum TaxID=2567896 RepID=UPI0010ADDE32|nr:hypothetical protein [Polyangium aurulentum]UQA57854.1 hypothetical protein E8A73_042350 [Polyangium aurulentum]
MHLRRLIFGLGIAGIAFAAALGFDEPDGAAPAHAADPPSAHGPRVALVATFPGAAHSSLYLVQAGDTANPAPVATFTHLPDAAVRAANLPGTDTVFATADTAETRDRSFNASLFRLRPHTPPETLCDRVVHASRPLVTPAGRVFVSRGTAGPELERQMRVDHLTIDEIDPGTGASRVVHALDGQLAFLAGWSGGEIVVYRIFAGGADLVGVDPDTGAVRTIVDRLPPFARDFSVDAAGGRLVFQNRHRTDARTWEVDEVDLATGRTRALHSGPSMTMAPAVLPGGGIVFNTGSAGLRPLDAPLRVNGPLGAGVDVIAATSPDHLAALHTVAGALPVPFLIEVETGAASLLPAPKNARIAIAGFVGNDGGAQ